MLKKLWRVVRWWELLLAPWIVTVLTFFFVAPRVTDSATGLVVMALIAGALSTFAAAFHLFEASPSKLNKVIATELVVVGLIAAVGWALFFNRPPPNNETVGDRGIPFERVKLSTGLHVAVARLPGDGQRPPVVFLHGGPGRPVSASDVTFFKSLAEKGIDVVLFDQGGVGESDTLPRSEVTVERAVAEVEALREKLGLETISIVGQSWGARLAIEYAGTHRNRVAKIALAGGAPLSADPKLWKFDNRRTALKKELSPLSFTPILAALILHGVNPKASESFASKEELNGMVAANVPAIFKRSVCEKDGDKATVGKVAGLDGTQFMLLRKPLETRDAPKVDPPAPTLVFRPECDFSQWLNAKDYRDRLKGQVVYLKGAGHAIWPLHAEPARDTLVAFFKDEPLPIPPYEADADPAGELPPLP